MSPERRNPLKHFFTSGRLHDLRLFLVFVGVAAVFWFIMALNEDVQTDFDVRIHVTGVPDTVTFITDPPQVLHVSVRDRGTALLRRKFTEPPVINLPYREFASDGRLRVLPSALMARLRAQFGTAAAINITSMDSISVIYTTAPGKFVPVRVVSDVTAALGKVVAGRPRPDVREVRVYAQRNILDTISYVSTENIVLRDLDKTSTFNVGIRPVRGVRIEPSRVKVTVTVEPLENRKAVVPVTAVGVPAGEHVALFPDKVEVAYLVPMSRSDDAAVPRFTVVADYTSASASAIPLRLSSIPMEVEGANLVQDSVQYTLIKRSK